MLHLSRAAETHEDLFIQRYQALEAWSLRLCGNDRQQAEDLVQDAFVAFTLSRPDLAGIDNLDGYLRGMLRKLQVSRVRRGAQGAQVTRSLLDQDSAELGLRAVGAATVEATQELACVCRYACLRKGSSKAGSILILRFFHGYFPSEIAQIARCTPHLVDDWLRIARREARLFREEPHRLRFLKSAQSSVPVNALDAVRTGEPAECLLALRAAIFHAHEGRCWTRRELAHAYETPYDPPAPDVPVTATLTLTKYAVRFRPEGQTVHVTNVLADIEGRVESYDAKVVSHQLVGRGARGSADFEHTLAAGVSQWRVSVAASLTGTDVVDAFLLDCTKAAGGCVVVDKASITKPGAVLVADEPAAGLWRVVIRTRGRAAGAIDYTIRHASLTPSGVPIQADDRKHATGARWSLTVAEPRGPGDAQYVAYRIAPGERDGGQKGIRIAMTPLRPDAP